MKDGGSAFPTPDIGGHPGSDGMTLRDYFAAAAMQGYCAKGTSPATNEKIAGMSYEMADAMLETRKQ